MEKVIKVLTIVAACIPAVIKVLQEFSKEA